MSLFAELKRRNVLRVAAAYIVVGWLVMQVADVLVPALQLPEWALTATLYFLLVGFLPTLVLAWAFELTPEGIRREKSVPREQSITAKTGRKLDFVIIGLLAIAVIYLVLDKLKPEPTAAAPETTQAVPEAEPQQPSIAVLPFANMSEDAANEYFSDGISEEILNALAKVRELKVAGRTSSFAFKGRNEDLRLIGQTLDVSHILEGSVRKAGNTVRVTAQLISVEDGYHLWSETWDRELTDIFAIQDEIAGAILVALKTELVGDESVATLRTDTQAYEKYLQAKQLIYTRSRPALERAAGLLDEVIALDENFAPAWAQRGVVPMLLAEDQYGTIPVAEAQAQSRRYLDRALALDPKLDEALAGLGLWYTREGGTENLASARQYLEQALAINPSQVNAGNWLYTVLSNEYRATEALAVLEDLYERDPLYPPLLGNLQLSYARLGIEGKMEPLIERVLPFRGDSPTFKMVQGIHHTQQGNHATALPLLEAAYAAAPDNSFIANAYLRSLFFLNDFERVADSPAKGGWPRTLALLYLGRTEEATMVASQRARVTDSPGVIFETLAHAGEHAALMQLVDAQWESLQQLSRDQPPALGFGSPDLIYIAEACLHLGREEQFAEAMALVRTDHDRQIAAGINWPIFWLVEAQYWTLANDHQRAIGYVEKIAEGNFLLFPRMARMYPLLKPLEGDPRYEAAQQRMLEKLNRQREAAGLEPLAPEYTL